ncbi:pseudouridine synthase [Paracoccus sp. 1_MG-2023]|uniref:pseudouridine synthase n=1 Tax=unclassified Paracoccus (in: a-proteobacteria) TaxID=2688777 RepID=UPI001C08996A|nr:MULTISPECIES: pseudouridine synthase [unclassified Paracoccus (in: a-proteobacteria)]MBU2957346.1 RNA pseudouridine synthase [Paracoccus sp. C2R09]MDO6670109.1 pseudouridine synthase [Paracoccus sp. 1_MG-2023]
MSDFVYDPPPGAPRVIHADHEVLVVEKPSGLLSVPGRGEDRADCLIARLREAFPTVLLVHRLDLDTSGVMVFGLTPHAQRHLSKQFEERRTKKVYVARLHGRLEPRTGRVDLPLIVDWPNRPRQKVDHDEGRPAQTDWRVVRADDAETRVRLMPVTGRSHQLRVHMAETGHAILGDPLYATGEARDHPRLMLHAESLRFAHPDGGVQQGFTSPAPF